MLSDSVLSVEGVSKSFTLYPSPSARLWQHLGLSPTGIRTFNALTEVSFQLAKGEILGVVGRNGAGKSTLLQLVCGILQPSTGKVTCSGRIAALLELGTGFNPEFTGKENVYLNASVLGLSKAEIDEKYDEIVAFAELAPFMDQAVKTYSSGMLVRLGFAVATSVQPDLLIVDEALSVGDGVFAKRSFDRIMALREQGTSILFCSHSLFQIESLCTQAIWLEKGKVMAQGKAADVVYAYQQFLDCANPLVSNEAGLVHHQSPTGHARLTQIDVKLDDQTGQHLTGISGQSCLTIRVGFASDPLLACPTAAITFSTTDGRIISSSASWQDGACLSRDDKGQGVFTLTYDRLPLLKGHYQLGVYLFCDRGLHTYDWADPVAQFTLTQTGTEQGIVMLPHQWHTNT